MWTGKAQWTMARAINSGLLYPSSFVGCHAGDRESYDDFKDFFYPVIEAYHKGFSMTEGSKLEGTIEYRVAFKDVAQAVAGDDDLVTDTKQGEAYVSDMAPGGAAKVKAFLTAEALVYAVLVK